MALYELEGIAPTIADGCWIAPDAVLIGKVQVERGVSIWWGAVLRGDNDLIHVGEDANIQDHCVLHTDIGYTLTVGPRCTIGHCAMLHGCTIGENTLIGIGAILLNGTKIGRNCIIGAHAFLPEGKEIPDNSLVVGSPGRIVRQLDDAAADRLRQMSEDYIVKLHRYSKGLKRID